MSRLGNLGARLYRGEVGYDFIGKTIEIWRIGVRKQIEQYFRLSVSELRNGLPFR